MIKLFEALNECDDNLKGTGYSVGMNLGDEHFFISHKGPGNEVYYKDPDYWGMDFVVFENSKDHKFYGVSDFSIGEAVIKDKAINTVEELKSYLPDLFLDLVESIYMDDTLYRFWIVINLEREVIEIE